MSDITKEELERYILENIDDIIIFLRPRWLGSSITMDGKYPCWSVHTCTKGTTHTKSLKDAIYEEAEFMIKCEREEKEYLQ